MEECGAQKRACCQVKRMLGMGMDLRHGLIVSPGGVYFLPSKLGTIEDFL